MKLIESILASSKSNPFWICGPCIVESKEIMTTIARKVKTISEKYKIPFVFKASFDKANRTSHESYRGQGIEEGLRALEYIKKEFELPILTDIHESYQAKIAAEVVDILQIPAFLCRQSDLLKAAAETNLPLNVKKGQFLSPSNVKNIVEKLKSFNTKNFWITERGVSFGYQRLVVDFAGFPEIEKQANIILDITHSVQLPGGEGNRTGGIREAIPYLSRAGAAVGVHGFFAETHPTPEKALSDGPNSIQLDELEEIVKRSQQIAELAHGK